MSSMDKRTAGRIGRPVRRQNIYVVLSKDPNNGDICIEKLLTNADKANAYVDQHLCDNNGPSLYIERWRLE